MHENMQSFDQRLPRWLWPTLCALVTLVALHGVFSASEIFFVRDLGAYYWSQHLWARATMLSGEIPLWDPHVAYGQPAVVDPVRHLLFLPVLVLRLVASDVVGFNLSVALPFPLAALGAFLFFRRHMSASGAALAGCAFVLSGPVLSTGNMLNLSWTTALVPWVFWAVDRLKERRSAGRFAALACVFALQAFAGEAVVLLCTGLLAVL